MRRLSLTTRHAADAVGSAETEIVLLHITHPDLAAPVLLSSDPTTRVSDDPLQYGTRSTWKGATEPYLFVLMSTALPDDLENQPQAATLVLEAVDQDMAAVLRSTIRRASVSMAVVTASSPNLVEAEFSGLELVQAEGDVSEIRLTISRDPITSEPFPAGRMTRSVFPGLHR